MGNRLTQETHNGPNLYAYDAANRLVEVDGITYTWDANGDLLNDGRRRYSSNHGNNLTAVPLNHTSISLKIRELIGSIRIHETNIISYDFSWTTPELIYLRMSIEGSTQQ
ncbi:MAG: hypothetical protein A2Z14_07270 [Chloroflexi bacterium RBG_16_48_8]|nr:MAG: hypothetical protein A2Z14_07270 [Chloroflexi bacterium RBG_16_48_8]